MSATPIPCLRYTIADIKADPLACLEPVMATAPIITVEGWGCSRLAQNRDFAAARAEMTAPWYVEQFVWAAEWLDLVPAQQTINRRGSSYGWKHVAEAWHERRLGIGRGYISNGMFLAACLAVGRRIQPVAGSINTYVAIPESARRIA